MTKNRVITIIIIVLLCTVLFSDPPNWVPITGTQYSMVVIAEISLYNQPFEGIGTNMAGAFGPGGETGEKFRSFTAEMFFEDRGKQAILSCFHR